VKVKSNQIAVAPPHPICPLNEVDLDVDVCTVATECNESLCGSDPSSLLNDAPSTLIEGIESRFFDPNIVRGKECCWKGENEASCIGDVGVRAERELVLEDVRSIGLENIVPRESIMLSERLRPCDTFRRLAHM
jgi:hypothetical protein